MIDAVNYLALDVYFLADDIARDGNNPLVHRPLESTGCQVDVLYRKLQFAEKVLTLLRK